MFVCSVPSTPPATRSSSTPPLPPLPPSTPPDLLEKAEAMAKKKANHLYFEISDHAYEIPLSDLEAPNQRIPILQRYPIGFFFRTKTQNMDGNYILFLSALICYVFLSPSRRDGRDLVLISLLSVRVGLEF